MKLHSLRIEPAGPAGWSSEQLVFGEHITELFGPNGCGKTPIIQSIAFALGYPVKFREDVLKKCGIAALSLEDHGTRIELRRRFDQSFDIEVRVGDQQTKTFYSDRDYSTYLLEKFGFGTPTLTSTNSDPVSPYMSTLLPIFYLDQDQGYGGIYRPPTTFIKDQYAEMMRLVFGLPPKHSFEQKKLLIEKRKRLDAIDRQVVKKLEFIEDLRKELGAVRRPMSEIDAQLLEIRSALDGLRESRSLRTDSHSAIDSLLYEKQVVQRALENEITELKSRVNGFKRIQEEIEVEVKTLSLNEEARRLFASFEDICSNPACGLFLGSSDSYGKNLLYLKDQVKDLQRNTEFQRARIDELNTGLKAVKKEIRDLEEKRDALTDGDEVDGLVSTIGQLTRELYTLQREKQSVEELDEEEKEYVKLLNERDTLQNDLAALGSPTESDLRMIEIRASLRDRIVHWLNVLKTRNVSREVTLDSDFGILFGAERITQLHGSTLVRAILAIHTATFELYTRDPANQLRFLILDTPRQQDIERDVLNEYVSALKALSITNQAQIVFSTTNYHYACVEGDKEWLPTFPGSEQKMFLGDPRAGSPLTSDGLDRLGK